MLRLVEKKGRAWRMSVVKGETSVRAEADMESVASLKIRGTQAAAGAADTAAAAMQQLLPPTVGADDDKNE